MRYFLEISPAIPPKDRHKIEDVLTLAGYDVHGGGQLVSGGLSNISFSDPATKEPNGKNLGVGDKEA